MRTKTGVLGILINEDNDDDTVELACSNAALNGHLECLKYAHEMDVLGMKILVFMLHGMVTSSV